MNHKTQKPPHHISSGGYIFHRDSDGIDHVVLIKNFGDPDWWIPKGHLEGDEDHLAAAYREIEEETGISENELSHYKFFKKIEYTFFDEKEIKNTKEVYIHIFHTKNKLSVRPEGVGQGVVEVAWMPASEAHILIRPEAKEDMVETWNLFKEFVERTEQ